ncbi:ABC transporter permease [Phoenicibacter congonensis]|uniref:ABC transporter permease n=1 Tax=Phoenicibacter congonensis TaxID=1944646 RepID=UPI0009A87F88|nr:ABC transporter permease [Phoenicibacter congonensis]
MSNSDNNTQALTRESEIATNAIETRTWKKNLFILKTLVGKDFKVKYRRSVLGVVWSVLNPLLMMIVMSAVFSYMFRFNIENFPLYLILGQIMFNLMSDATSGAMQSIIGAASLIQKIRIEKMVFPLEKVIFSLVNFLFSAIAAVAVMIYFRIMPTWDILFLPLCIVYVVAFSAGLGLILSSLAVFFRDVIHLWSVVLTAWTYATPLFYPLELLPDTLQFLIQFNPMYQYITYFRDIMMYGITPTLEQNLICIAMAAISLALGILVFRKTEHKFILYV